MNITKYFGPLFMEKKDGYMALSVGRVSWWIALGPAIYIWIKNGGAQDISEYHSTLLLILATYNLGKHGLSALNKNSQDEGPG